MPGIKEAHIGLVSASEFLSLVDDGSGGILKSLFYDNVRDWQDYNPVNTEIRDTIVSPSERARFALMNNGITIIAKNVRATANKFFVEDYQIVNGCQTSHVLFDQRAHLDQTVYIPLRLIATDDEEVVAAIVKATNRQTEVKQEQLIALSDFQKKLEGYFSSFDELRRLFYERRSRQYGSASGVEKTRIVTPNNLIRGYASMFLMEPHRTTRNYRRLLERVGKDIFGSEHKLEPYYASAWAWHMLEVFFKYRVVDARFKTARYQVLMAARILANVERPPRPNSHEMGRYADKISTLLWDIDKCFKIFGDAVALVESISAGSLDGDTVRTEGFTEKLREAAERAARGAG